MSSALAADALTLAAEDRLRVDCYRLLARLFAAPPDAALLASLRQSATGAADELGTLWNELCAASLAGVADAGVLAQEYEELFFSVGQPKVVAYASWYRKGSMMDTPLAELRTDLARLGLARRQAIDEPEDHFAAVLEAMGLLVAEANGAQADFFQRHLAPWFDVFCTAVAARDESVFYRAAARFVRGFLANEQEWLTR